MVSLSNLLEMHKIIINSFINISENILKKHKTGKIWDRTKKEIEIKINQNKIIIMTVIIKTIIKTIIRTIIITITITLTIITIVIENSIIKETDKENELIYE